MAFRVVGGQVDELDLDDPDASANAVSTESVSRCLIAGFTDSRSTTTSMLCRICLSSAGGSVSWWIEPSTRTRVKPCVT